jgi:hypothetical protein
MNRLQRTLVEAKQRNWKVATVNLLVEHNVPVTLRSSSETASAEPLRRNSPATR